MIVGAMVNGKPTYTTAGVGGCACHDPVLCVSVMDTHYITAGISKTGYFNVNTPCASLVKETDYCGIISGKNADKSTAFTLYFDAAEETLLIEECPLNFLCKVCDTKETRGFTIFFGDVAIIRH